MDPEFSADRSEEGDPKVVCRAVNAMIAEHIRLLLAVHDIRAAVIQRDPIRAMAATADLLLAGQDCRKSQRVLSEILANDYGGDWGCPSCHEEVPRNFDVCWSCGASHPSLANPDAAVIDSEDVETAK
ncbi:hypothetical protein [Planctomyces sp. SH-PL14]|uniref:hypothetical protein n=1 Tax=Planctomyces sp. SH-PL14 TaxID=1632864 RepID=UPI00078D893D|nr:hypothetical protein [Planctomyces sp. SH-PL14]AMV20589.1 hypothetical protein VT03_22005 [Planctomyces sp. SH-PL14]